jgi:hypothetical protein
VVVDREGCERDLVCGWMYVVLYFWFVRRRKRKTSRSRVQKECLRVWIYDRLVVLAPWARSITWEKRVLYDKKMLDDVLNGMAQLGE